MTDKSDQREYILRILDQTGWSQTDLAKRAGLDPSTLSRFLARSDEPHALRTTTLRRIASASGTTWPENTADTPAPSGFEEDEAAPMLAPPPAGVGAALAALQADHPNTDAWVLQSRALELAGYKPHDIVLVRLGEVPLRGDVVCAQVYHWARNRADTVFRLYQPPFLVTATTDPAHMTPLAVDDDRVTIKGVVVHLLRNRPSV